MTMKLEDIGYSTNLDQFLRDRELDKKNVGRVSAVHKDSYTVITADSELRATITGNYQYSVNSSAELPAVGDWVYLSQYDDGQALITQLLPRMNRLERRAAGKESDVQIIAANIDYGLIVEAVGDHFNLNRIERFLAICNTSNIKPIIIITKTDLITDKESDDLIKQVTNRLNSIQVLTISNLSKVGIDSLRSILQKGKTYCLLGLSGVGKSSLINNLFGNDVLTTKAISSSTNKGVHTTTHRELFKLENGSIIIDNPGMREIGLTDATDDIDSIFGQIAELSKVCRFSNCTHTHEKGCAILAAIEQGALEQAQFDNYQKMKREQFHFSASVAEKRKKDKEFGKMVKDILKTKTKKRH